MSKDIKTYKEMNAKICGLLRLNGDQVSLYAAQRIKELEAENQSLRDRLGKSIELPCKVGDTVYWIETFAAEARIDKYVAKGFSMEKSQNDLRVILTDWLQPVIKVYKGSCLFFDRAEAEARLAELGEKNGREED